jgi:hypothetical protein
MVALEHDIPIAAPSSISADAIPIAARRAGASLRQVFAVTLIGTVFLAFFASRDLPSWGERLGDGPAALAVRSGFETWDDMMAGLGLTRPHEALRATVKWLLEQSWRTDDP